jgi:hypothetical protein
MEKQEKINPKNNGCREMKNYIIPKPKLNTKLLDKRRKQSSVKRFGFVYIFRAI